MNLAFLIHECLNVGPDGAPPDMPSLADYLGHQNAASLTFEVGQNEDPIRILTDDPDQIDMAAANGLSRWIGGLRSASRPWDLLALKGVLEPLPARGDDTDLDLIVLRAAAFIIRSPLPEALTAQLRPDDRVIMSVSVRQKGSARPVLTVHTELEDRQLENQLSDRDLAALTYHLQNCEFQIAQCMTAALPWFQSSGIRQMTLAIELLPN